MRFLAPWLALASTLLAPAAAAQAGVPELEVTLEPEPWSFSGSAFYSDPPGLEDRVTAILYADRGPLHLEGRYNYEDLETFALFGGWTFTWEGALEASLTPMLGGVTGRTDGVAPALEVDLGWRRIAWYAEMEYLFDLEERDDDYFYSWSTLTYGLTDWMSVGIVAERTKLIDTDWSLQRGLALQVSGANLGFSLYAYNLGTDDDYAVVALELAP